MHKYLAAIFGVLIVVETMFWVRGTFTFIPALIWGVAWIAIAVGVFLTTLRNLPKSAANADGLSIAC